MKKLTGILIVILLFGCKSNRIDKECQPALDSFFVGIATGKHMESLDKFLRTNKNFSLQDSAVLDLRNKFNTLNIYSGKYIGYKLLKKRNLQDDVMVYSYLVKYERKFYRFVFIFYRPGDTPQIYKFLFDDVLDTELEESLKLYLN